MPLITIKSRALPFLGVILAIVFWLLDALVDVYLFGEATTFFASLLSPDPVELWMRIIVTILLICFTFYSASLLNRQNEATKKLQQQKKEVQRINSQLQREVDERVKAEHKLKHLAAHDSLTSLLNRRKFDEILESEIGRERRQLSGLTLVFCDIDHFKKVNDQYGHGVGDNVLKLFAERLQSIVRETDIVARWGGEEFIILLPDTAADATEMMANKIQTEIESFEFDPVGKVTVSIGVTHLKDKDSREAMLKRADQALYTAKEKGRNRVEISS